MENRIKLLKKVKKNCKPTEEELEEAYGYLDCCYVCGEEFNFLDKITFNIEHGFLGNSHRRNCE